MKTMIDLTTGNYMADRLNDRALKSGIKPKTKLDIGVIGIGIHSGHLVSIRESIASKEREPVLLDTVDENGANRIIHAWYPRDEELCVKVLDTLYATLLDQDYGKPEHRLLVKAFIAILMDSDHRKDNDDAFITKNTTNKRILEYYFGVINFASLGKLRRVSYLGESIDASGHGDIDIYLLPTKLACYRFFRAT